MAGKSREVFVGVDSGTQSTKVLLVDGDTGAVLGSGSAAHELIGGLPPGHLEQQPADWFAAVETAMKSAFASCDASPGDVRGIGVSGQQHGFVALGKDGAVIRPAKLWCDTSTAGQCDAILAKLGGLERCIALTGNGLPPGFTASKIAWLKETEPENYKRLARVLLPHDYLNYRLSGVQRMECGDASGTALLNVRQRTWCAEMIAAVDGDLANKLPPLMPPDEPWGTLSTEIAARWEMPTDAIVSPGGGDNMMSAIGTGNVADGVVTVSLGTSGTIFAYSSSPVVDPKGEVAAFCDSTGAWLPLVCTMNVTVATELTKQLFGMDTPALESAVQSVPAGANGLMLVPYFEGERTPNVPNGTGVWFGANRTTHTPAHFARAAMEGATLGLAYGLNRFRELGISPSEIRLTGGGSKSPAWRQICADVFDTPVVCLKQSESAAFGGALQAKWIHARQADSSASIADLANAWVQLERATQCAPEATSTAKYAKLSELHGEVSQALRSAFDRHRMLLQ
ncbi:MAG: xylulokinase [Phycisphaerales bacterium]|nr:xylulokinase [Phycisphaerales bacterium]